MADDDPASRPRRVDSGQAVALTSAPSIHRGRDAAASASQGAPHMLKFLIGAAAAFALLVATPAAACDDCKSCPHGKKETAAATEQKGTMVAEDKKEEHKGCGCNHEGSKECKCGEKCK